MADLVTVGVVGALIGETVIFLEETIRTIEMLRSPLTSILDRLNGLKAVFDDMMRAFNGSKDRPDEELRPLHGLLRQCQGTVKKCKTIRKWQLYDKHQCSKELDLLDIQIALFCRAHLVAIIDRGKEEAINNLKRDGMMDKIRDEMERMHLPPVETENNDNIEKDEPLDRSEPVIVESAAAAAAAATAGGYDEQVKASSYQYDVFLSFRGDDTRDTFTSFLSYALCSYKVKPFMDIILRKGNKLEELLHMVEKSRISVVVFSENFAESTWCLKELAKIFEERDRRGHEVVPVFYKVSPSELRHQDSGKTKVHMEKHHNTYGKDSDTVKTWTKAITKLADLSGYTYWSGTGKSEVDLALEIAQDILTRLHGRKVGEQGSSSNLRDIISGIPSQLEEDQV